MPTTIRVERPDGSTDNPVHVASSWTQKFGEMDMATINIPRSEGVSLDLQEDDDEVILEENGTDIFGGVLRTTESKESVMELTVEGWETLAADAGRTPPGQRRENVSDGTIVSEAVSAAPRLTAGTINDVETGLTFVFASASQARKTRQAEESGEGELRYNGDLTVDYLSSLGTDKSGSVVVSPNNQNTDGGVEVKKNTRVRRGTHLRVLGAGEGSHQRFANVVPNDDPVGYENEVRYDAGVHWEPGDRKKWETVPNKEATTQSAVDAVGRAAAEEIREKHVTVTATIKGEDVSLGDTLRVEKQADNIDRDLRVVRRRRLDDNDGLRYECDLSNRRKFDKSPSERDRADTEKYNRAFEGTPVTMTTGGGRQPVSSSLNYEFDFYYPDEVAYEHRVKLFVKGLAYRAYSSGAASGGDHTHSFSYIATGAHSHSITEAEFDHTHNLTSATSADSHGHADGTLGADSHPHADGTLDADDHDHTDGTLDADDHDHTDGTFDADDHEHNQNITETSTNSSPDVDFEVTSDVIGIGAQQVDQTFDLPFVNGNGAYGILYIESLNKNSSSDQLVPEVEVRNNTQSNTFYRESSSGLLPGESTLDVAVTIGDVEGDEVTVTLNQENAPDVDMKLSVSTLVFSVHDHSVDITQSTLFTQPGVSGVSGNTQPTVTGRVANTQPGVTGDTAGAAPGVSGDTGNTGPNVSGGTDTPGATATTETETETTDSVTTTGNKDHTHPPEAGVIEDFGGTVYFPGSCEVLVNGSPVGVSLGDGTGTFEQEVDLAGELNPGRVNTIEVTSGSLGHVQAHLDIDVYRQILGDG